MAKMRSRLAFLVACILCLGSVAAQCGSGSAVLTVAIQYDSNPGQTSAVLTNTQSGSTIELPISKIANQLVTYNRCVDVNTLYKIALKDSGGNGFSGSGYASISINERLIATVSDFGSEVAYYFSSAAQDCGDPRWVLDIKYDSNPPGVSAALTGGGLVFSLSGLNGADLAGQFVHIDRCFPPRSYSFSITSAGGISSPGFYRIFSEYTLLAVGGGDNGFKGTESTSFVVTDGPVPTPSPTPDVCDDAWEEKFVDEDGNLQNCIWLKDRIATEKTRHCSPGKPAWTLCEETCGACTDNCDDQDNIKFSINGISGRNCQYVRVRLSADFDKFFPQFCAPGLDPYTYCKESCENCGNSGSTTSGSPTPSPTPDPMLTDPCDDSATRMIFVNGQEVSCRWLQANPSEQATVCKPGHISNAYNVCEETCGKCSDTCEDNASASFPDAGGTSRACSWLADDLKTRGPLYCFPGSEAWNKCKESCANCVSA